MQRVAGTSIMRRQVHLQHHTALLCVCYGVDAPVLPIHVAGLAQRRSEPGTHRNFDAGVQWHVHLGHSSTRRITRKSSWILQWKRLKSLYAQSVRVLRALHGNLQPWMP